MWAAGKNFFKYDRPEKINRACNDVNAVTLNLADTFIFKISKFMLETLTLTLTPLAKIDHLLFLQLKLYYVYVVFLRSASSFKLFLKVPTKKHFLILNSKPTC